MWRTLGHSLMVELRTLTPSVLVRIQLPQPRIQPAYSGFFYWLHVAQFGHVMNIALGQQGVVEHKHCAVRNVTIVPQVPPDGIRHPKPRIQSLFW